MPWRETRVVVTGLVWERPELPSIPERPWFPGAPDIGLPGEPEGPWVPGFPGQGPVLPGRPERPPWERPELPGRPDFPVYEVIDPGDAGGHPEAEDLDLNATRKIAVTDGDNVFPAYAVVSGDSEEPRHPERGLPGSWVTVGYHGAVVWAWSPSLTLPERPSLPERPGQGLPGGGGRPGRPGRPGQGLPE